jgi:hypothetical protein
VPRFILGRAAVRKLHGTIDELFNRAKARLFGRDYSPKQIIFSAKPIVHREDLSLGGIFDSAAHYEGVAPNEELKASLHRIAEGYLDAAKERAKSNVVHAVQSFVTDAEHKGKKVESDIVIGGELEQVLGRVADDVKRIINTESTKARNFSAVDAISKVNLAAGITDPVVVFLGPNDTHTCDECRRLFFLPDGTPRAWLRSELMSSYHKHGADSPSMSGCHPNCRHTPRTLLPGFGFNDEGRIAFIAPGHSELDKQRGG